MEAFVFAYISLQPRFVIDDLNDPGENVWSTAAVGLIVQIAVIAPRFAFIFAICRRLPRQRGTWIRRLAAVIELPGYSSISARGPKRRYVRNAG
ncbi:MAG TPA: hypothetical protein VF201_08935 [Nitrolancea sp.]